MPTAGAGRRKILMAFPMSERLMWRAPASHAMVGAGRAILQLPCVASASMAHSVIAANGSGIWERGEQ